MSATATPSAGDAASANYTFQTLTGVTTTLPVTALDLPLTELFTHLATALSASSSFATAETVSVLSVVAPGGVVASVDSAKKDPTATLRSLINSNNNNTNSKSVVPGAIFTVVLASPPAAAASNTAQSNASSTTLSEAKQSSADSKPRTTTGADASAKVSGVTVWTCVNCYAAHPPTSHYCRICGLTSTAHNNTTTNNSSTTGGSTSSSAAAFDWEQFGIASSAMDGASADMRAAIMAALSEPLPSQSNNSKNNNNNSSNTNTLTSTKSVNSAEDEAAINAYLASAFGTSADCGTYAENACGTSDPEAFAVGSSVDSPLSYEVLTALLDQDPELRHQIAVAIGADFDSQFRAYKLLRAAGKLGKQRPTKDAAAAAAGKAESGTGSDHSAAKSDQLSKDDYNVLLSEIASDQLSIPLDADGEGSERTVAAFRRMWDWRQITTAELAMAVTLLMGEGEVAKKEPLLKHLSRLAVVNRAA